MREWKSLSEYTKRIWPPIHSFLLDDAKVWREALHKTINTHLLTVLSVAPCRRRISFAHCSTILGLTGAFTWSRRVTCLINAILPKLIKGPWWGETSYVSDAPEHYSLNRKRRTHEREIEHQGTIKLSKYSVVIAPGIATYQSIHRTGSRSPISFIRCPPMK